MNVGQNVRMSYLIKKWEWFVEGKGCLNYKIIKATVVFSSSMLKVKQK